jgi:hypothetical protein
MPASLWLRASGIKGMIEEAGRRVKFGSFPSEADAGRLVGLAGASAFVDCLPMSFFLEGIADGKDVGA